MLAAAPIASLFLIYLTVCLWRKRAGSQEWRSSLLAAAVVWGVLLVVSTEILGLFRGITAPSLMMLWTLAGTAALLLTVRLLRVRRTGHAVPMKWAGTSVRRLRQIAREQPWSLPMVAASAAIALILAIIALEAPPNTWDSMTYHMARVVHWIQDRSVASFPTSSIRQINDLVTAFWLVCFVYFVLALMGRSPLGAPAHERDGDAHRGAIADLPTRPSAAVGAGPAPIGRVERWDPWPALGAGASLGLACVTNGTA